jgi:hypothetical protein
MSLAEYFENVRGIGILGTADADGKVDLAIYARPHVVEEDTVVFLMRDRLSHSNVTANPHAAYLFIEQGDGYNGLRLYLTRRREETDPQKIEALRREEQKGRERSGEETFLVYFKVDQARRLVGS